MSVMNTLSDLKRIVSGTNIDVGPRQAKVVAISARKGGVGKTTTAVNAGAGLALFHGKKVLIIDMDAQSHVAMSLRAEGRGRPPKTLSNILLEPRRDIFEVVQPTSIDGLWFVAADGELNNTEAVMTSRIGKELLLKKALRYARTHFDVILIDCPPNLGNLTVNALVAADSVLVPCDLSTLSLDGVDALLDTLAIIQETLNPGINLLGMVRTRVDRRNQQMNAAINEALEQRYGAWLLEAEIGVSTAIAKAQHAGRPIFLHDKKCRGAKAYIALADELNSRLFSD